MKVLFDTSMLVAGMVSTHTAHDRAVPWLKKVKSREITGVVASHTLAEVYAVLTTLPARPRLSASVVHELILRDILDAFDVVSLLVDDYRAVLAQQSALGNIGGTVYDAIILRGASQAGVDGILTLNPKHFRRANPELVDLLIPV